MNKPEQQAQVAPLPIQYYIPNNNDEVNLFDLAVSIIKQWKILVVISGIGMLIAFGYTQFKPEEYKNFAIVRVPLVATIAAFNANGYRQLGTELSSDRANDPYELAEISKYSPNQTTLKNGFQLFTPEKLFIRYYEQIRSVEAFKDFLLKTNILDQFQVNFTVDSEKQEYVRALLNKLTIEILESKNQAPQLLKIEMTSNNESAAIQTINNFLVYTEQNIIQQILEEKRLAVIQRSKLIDIKINLFRNSAKQRRLNRITHLEEAFTKAKSMNITLPTSLSTLGLEKNSLQTQVYVFTKKQKQRLFLMGSKYLQTEINLLKLRSNSNTGDDPYINGLQHKFDELSILEKISFDFSGAHIYILDKIAAKNDAPVKPNKKLVMSLGTVLSLFLAVFVALIIAAVIKRRENNT